MAEIEIELQETAKEQSGSTQLPLNFLSFGEIENDDVKVYIKQSVYKELEKFASSNTDKELGSILIGSYAEELGKTHVVISQWIEAKYTDASAATLTFTHDSWDYIHKEHEKRYPEDKIIGWQHTHPNYGIFLSNYDMFIQENFFNMPFQIAYVIDPVQNLRGFFQWKNGKIQKLKGFYVYDDVGKPIKIEQSKRKQAERKKSKVLPVVAVLLLLLSLGLGGAMLIQQENYQKELQAKNKELRQKEQTIAALQAAPEDPQPQNPDLSGQLEEFRQTIEAKDALIQSLQDQLAAIPETPENQVTFLRYTVKAGDSLENICIEQGVDYVANYRQILSINDISDPNKIYVGQVLLLPQNP